MTGLDGIAFSEQARKNTSPRPHFRSCVVLRAGILFGGDKKMAKRFKKSADRKLFGVCGGVAEYFDIDPTIVRIVWILMVVFAGFGILLYIILALLMPNR